MTKISKIFLSILIIAVIALSFVGCQPNPSTPPEPSPPSEKSAVELLNDAVTKLTDANNYTIKVELPFLDKELTVERATNNFKISDFMQNVHYFDSDTGYMLSLQQETEDNESGETEQPTEARGISPNKGVRTEENAEENTEDGATEQKDNYILSQPLPAYIFEDIIKYAKDILCSKNSNPGLVEHIFKGASKTKAANGEYTITKTADFASNIMIVYEFLQNSKENTLKDFIDGILSSYSDNEVDTNEVLDSLKAYMIASKDQKISKIISDMNIILQNYDTDFETVYTMISSVMDMPDYSDFIERYSDMNLKSIVALLTEEDINEFSDEDYTELIETFTDNVKSYLDENTIGDIFAILFDFFGVDYEQFKDILDQLKQAETEINKLELSAVVVLNSDLTFKSISLSANVDIENLPEDFTDLTFPQEFQLLNISFNEYTTTTVTSLSDVEIINGLDSFKIYAPQSSEMISFELRTGALDFDEVGEIEMLSLIDDSETILEGISIENKTLKIQNTALENLDVNKYSTIQFSAPVTKEGEEVGELDFTIIAKKVDNLLKYAITR